MPKEGWKSITISSEIYDAVKDKAEKESRTVTKQAEFLIKKALEMS